MSSRSEDVALLSVLCPELQGANVLTKLGCCTPYYTPSCRQSTFKHTLAEPSPHSNMAFQPLLLRTPRRKKRSKRNNMPSTARGAATPRRKKRSKRINMSFTARGGCAACRASPSIMAQLPRVCRCAQLPCHPTASFTSTASAPALSLTAPEPDISRRPPTHRIWPDTSRRVRNPGPDLALRTPLCVSWSASAALSAVITWSCCASR